MTSPTYHQVQPGETLNSIAREKGTTVAWLEAWNPRGNTNFIAVGDMLIVPTPSTVGPQGPEGPQGPPGAPGSGGGSSVNGVFHANQWAHANLTPSQNVNGWNQMMDTLPQGAEIEFDAEPFRVDEPLRITKAFAFTGKGGISRIPNGGKAGTVIDFVGMAGPPTSLIYFDGSSSLKKPGFQWTGIDVNVDAKWIHNIMHVHNWQNWDIEKTELVRGYRGLYVTKVRDNAYWGVRRLHTHSNTRGVEVYLSGSGNFHNCDDQATSEYNGAPDTYGYIVNQSVVGLDQIKVHRKKTGFVLGGRDNTQGATGSRAGIATRLNFEGVGDQPDNTTAIKIVNHAWNVAATVNYSPQGSILGLHITDEAKGVIINGGSYDGASWGNAKAGSRTIRDDWGGDSNWPKTTYIGRHRVLTK